MLIKFFSLSAAVFCFVAVFFTGLSAQPAVILLPDVETVHVEKTSGDKVVAKFVWRRIPKHNTFEVFLVDGNKERKLTKHALFLDIGGYKHKDKNWVRFQAPDTNDQVVWFEAIYVGGKDRIFKDGQIEYGQRGGWRGTF